MLTKADFQQAISDSIDNYPTIARLYSAGDPRVIQPLDAIATMLSMLSAQIDVALAEPFEKTRDATVLADAAMRGLIPQATPARVELTLINSGGVEITLDAGRNLLDSSGYLYKTESTAVVPANGTVTVIAKQIETTEITHTVTNSAPFYAVEIPESNDGSYLSEVSVSDSIGDYAYRNSYISVDDGERVYHMEVNDQQQVFVRFGYDGVVGYQPPNGEVITLSISRSRGAIDVEYGSPFSLEYIIDPNETQVEIAMEQMVESGKDPLSIDDLRSLAKYPAVYDDSAVFLGEFEFLVRRHHKDLRFVSVWNEAIEERARGADIRSINCLFVACQSDSNELTITELPGTTEVPIEIREINLSAEQIAIKNTLLAADDSYRVRFYTPVISLINMTVSAVVATSYLASTVRQAIIDALIEEFGATSYNAKRGMNRPRHKRVYEVLRDKIPALDDENSDFSVEIEDAGASTTRPELWRYVSEDSLTVTVETANISAQSWGA